MKAAPLYIAMTARDEAPIEPLRYRRSSRAPETDTSWRSPLSDAGVQATSIRGRRRRRPPLRLPLPQALRASMWLPG
jgi:hypothetical protein